MHPYDLHPELYNTPILLIEEEMASNMIVLHQFYDDYHLINIYTNKTVAIQVFAFCKLHYLKSVLYFTLKDKSYLVFLEWIAL